MTNRRWTAIIAGIAVLLALSACEDSTNKSVAPGDDADAATQGPDATNEDTGTVEMDVADTGAVDSADDADESGPPPPTITQFEIDPESIPETSTGMNDQYFEVTFDVSGFGSPIREVELSLTGLGRRAPNPSNRTMTVDNNTVVISNITYTWFQNLDPGSYGITATVTAESGESITKEELATVEVTQ